MILDWSDFDYPFTLETDVSLKGYGAMLSQKLYGRVIVKGFANRMIRPVMSKYSTFKLLFQAMLLGYY